MSEQIDTKAELRAAAPDELKDFAQAFGRLKNRQVWKSWVEPCDIHCADDDTGEVVLTTEKAFAVKWMRENISVELKAAAAEVWGEGASVTVRHGKVVLPKRPKDPAEQLDFFVPQIAETALRDEIHLMEVAPFTLSKRESRTKIVYTNKTGMNLTITCHEEYGMMTAHDYDFVLMMMSHLNARANQWRAELARWKANNRPGVEPEKPPRIFRPHANDIIKFSRRTKTGRSYQEIEAMLDRLKSCVIKVARTGARKRRAGTFSFIEGYEVVSRATTGNVLEVAVTCPDWIYEGIVRTENPTLLTIDPDYLLLQRPLGKFLYRLAKLQARSGEATMPLTEVHERSGSAQSLKEFNRELRNYVGDLSDLEGSDNAFPEYRFAIIGGARARTLYIKARESGVQADLYGL